MKGAPLALVALLALSPLVAPRLALAQPADDKASAPSHESVRGSDAPREDHHGKGRGHKKGGGHGEGQGDKTGTGDGHHAVGAASAAAHGAGAGEHGKAGHADLGTADHGAHGAHGEEHKAFNLADFGDKKTPPFVGVLFNFGLLLLIYFKMGKNPVVAGLKSRRDGVAKEIEEAQRMLAEANKRAKVYQARLENLDVEQETARKALEEVGKGERDRIVREAQEKAERLQRDARFLIDQEVKQMAEDLKRETANLAVDAARKLLAEKVSQADHERLAVDFLADLSRKPSASASRGGS